MRTQPEPDLVDLIADIIRAEGGRITFERYMELALYHPRRGYYAARPPIGKTGDFLTNVSVGPLFGRILASQFLKIRTELGNPPDFQIIEFGGHRGRFRDDVLREAPELDYQIIESGNPFPERFTGCVFTNEFLDALPVHRVRVVGGCWKELYVVTAVPGGIAPQECRRDSGYYKEEEGPLSSPRLQEALKGLPTHLMEGYTTEVNLRALDWMTDVAQRLTRGTVITIDYGYERDQYFAPHRQEGTLLCYHHHTENRNPFIHVGNQDITTHVEFTSLMEQGRRNGLETVLFCDQSQYLLEAGHEILAKITARDGGQWSPERNQIHQLIHPTLMGSTFKVLVQQTR